MSTGCMLSILVNSQSGYHLVYYMGLSLVRCSYLSVGSLHYRDGLLPSCVGDVMCCNEFVGYQGTANGSCICEGPGGLAINVDSEFECLEWRVLRCAYCSLVGSDRDAAI